MIINNSLIKTSISNTKTITNDLSKKTITNFQQPIKDIFHSINNAVMEKNQIIILTSGENFIKSMSAPLLKNLISESLKGIHI